MNDHDDGFIHHFDFESELYTAMAEETDGLGPPELDMDRVYNAGRRRRTVLVGSGAALVLAGATAVAVVAGSGGSDGGGTSAAGTVGSVGSSSPVPTGTPAPAPAAGSASPCDRIPIMSLPAQFAPKTPSASGSTPGLIGKAETGRPSNVLVSTVVPSGASQGCPVVVHFTAYTGPGGTYSLIIPSGGSGSYVLVSPPAKSSASAASSR